jgi:hypothetical protein
MSVFLVKTDNSESEPLGDDDKAKFSYEVTDSGVLRVLCADKDLQWWVLREYAPHAWSEVSGTRYLADTSKLSGFGGKAEQKTATVHVF